MNMDYVRLAKGLQNQKSELVKTSDNIYSIVKGQLDKDWYTSLFNYSKEHVITFNDTKSVAGIRGLRTNKVLFDFDSNEVENAKKDAIITCDRLIKAGIKENDLRIFFSGNKGFHVELILKDSLTRQEFVNITFGIAGDLNTFDQKINDEARVIRLALSKHPKTNLYKVPLSFDELQNYTISQIKKLAINGSDYDETLLDEKLYLTSLTPELLKLKAIESKKLQIATEMIETKAEFDKNDLDINKSPKWLDKARYALSEGFFYGSESGKGERNTAFMILAATFKGQGFSYEHTLALLETTANKQSQRTGESEYTSEQLKREVMSTVYSPTWKGGVYARDEELLVVTRNRFGIAEVTENKVESVKIGDVGDTFKSFAKNIERNIVKTGLKSLDDQVMITSGMMVSLLAAPGAGKTSFANLFVENLSKAGESSIFFSMDMYENLLFSRLLQRYSGYDMRKILEMFKADKPDKTLLEAYNSVLKNYNNASFNFRSGPTVEQIEQEVVDFQNETGKPVKLIVVDYLEKVRGPFADATANSAYVASRLSDIAKKHHCVVMLLVQPQKSAGDPRDELNSYRKIKGASVIEQDSRVVLTLSRPGYNPKDMSDDKFATISVVKNNMGGMGQIDFGWEGVSGAFTELDSANKAYLAALRKEIAEEKAVAAADSW